MKRILAMEPELVALLVKAVLVCAVAFGLPISGAQTGALIGIVVPALGVISGVTRQLVTPVAKVAEVLEKPLGLANAVLKEVHL